MLHQCSPEGSVPKVPGPKWSDADWGPPQLPVSVPDRQPELQGLHQGLLRRPSAPGPQQVCLQQRDGGWMC